MEIHGSQKYTYMVYLRITYLHHKNLDALIHFHNIFHQKIGRLRFPGAHSGIENALRMECNSDRRVIFVKKKKNHSKKRHVRRAAIVRGSICHTKSVTSFDIW